MFETGRLCLKTAGREAGKLCVVLDKSGKDFVFVTGPKILTGVRKRKCNIEHLEPLQAKIKIKADSGDEEILELLKKEAEVLEKFKLKIPSDEEIKKMNEQKTEKAYKKDEIKKRAEAEKPKEQPKKEKPVTISDLAAEKAKLLEQEKEKKPISLSDMTIETKKLEPAKKKESKEKKK